MQKLLFIVVLLIISVQAFGQAKVVKFPALDSYITSEDNDAIKVINFWATWCGPCVKELPFIDSLSNSYAPEELEVLLVSLDFSDQLDRVNKFLDHKSIVSTVWLLDESDANSYIDKVDPRWSGAIPMTLLIKPSTGDRIFLEKELTKEELERHIKILLDQNPNSNEVD